MKITAHESTRAIYLTTETPSDCYSIGRIAAKLKGRHAFEKPGENFELQLDFKDVVDLLAQ